MRINELARELEVKAKAILDYLVELGITDKRSHSSSIEPDIADKVRRHLAPDRYPQAHRRQPGGPNRWSRGSAPSCGPPFAM